MYVHKKLYKYEYKDVDILHTKKKFGNNNQVYELLMLRRNSFNQMTNITKKLALSSAN